MTGRWIIGLSLAFCAAAVAAGIAAGWPRWFVEAAAAGPLLVVALAGVFGARSERGRAHALARRIADLEGRIGALTDELTRTGARLQSLDEPVLVISAGGRIAACNPAAGAILGLRTDRLLGRPAEEAFTSADLLALYERARSGERVREQVRVARPEGIRVWDVSAAPLAGAPGEPPGVLMCPRDATAAALALRVRADFVANASHELRTPIAAMRIALDTLESLDEDDEAMRRRLDGVIASNVARLEEMARDLLDLSRLESEETVPKPAPLALSDLMRELRATFEPACAARRLSLIFDLAPQTERLRCDRRLLTLILGNLIDNAAKFAFEGTQIRVIARAAPSPVPPPAPSNPAAPSTSAAAAEVDAPASPPHRPPRSGIRFEVIDRGIGIPLDQQARIFERYYQVNAARTPGQPKRGTGLGLAIVKHSVRALGGTIRVQSVWQRGTTMIVEIPDCVDIAP